MRIALIAAAAAAATLVTGCATTAASTGPARVTRFHLNQPIVPGTIAPSAVTLLADQPYDDAVRRQLAALGFTPAARETARYLYVVTVSSNVVEGSRRSPVSVGVGVGGGSGGWGRSGVGVGVGTSFPVGRPGAGVTNTQLQVRLVDRATVSTQWEGRAEASGRADPAMMADRLAAALFAGFPGESGRTITVR